MRSSLTHASEDLGEKYGIGQSVPPCVIIDVIESTIPKQWNIGTCIIIRSAVERSILSPIVLPLFTILRCVSITPLGNPVVPDVYCILHTSSGLTSDARRRTSSLGMRVARESICSHVRQPSISKPTVTTLRKKGRFLEYKGLPGSSVLSSGQSSSMISL